MATGTEGSLHAGHSNECLERVTEPHKDSVRWARFLLNSHSVEEEPERQNQGSPSLWQSPGRAAPWSRPQPEVPGLEWAPESRAGLVRTECWASDSEVGVGPENLHFEQPQLV